MDLHGAKESGHFVDHTSSLTPSYQWQSPSGLDPRTMYQQADYHRRQLEHKQFRDFWKTASPYEKTLMQDSGFSPSDIVLLRVFHSRPDQIINGWRLLNQDSQPQN